MNGIDRTIALDREGSVRMLFPLLRRLATRVMFTVNSAVDVDDLIGDGALGLLRAIDTYDPSYGTTLEQYARKLAIGAMLNGLRRIDPVSERAVACKPSASSNARIRNCSVLALRPTCMRCARSTRRSGAKATS
jgi:RNA polymerase sigma factor (sigma-70 family)